MQVSVLAEVGGHADDLGPLAGEFDQRVAEGRGSRHLPVGGIEAIITEVVRRFFLSVLMRSSRRRGIERQLPSVLVDADEVLLLWRL